MAITEKIIGHLPEFYQAQIRRKLLYKVIDVFGLQLQEAENSFAEIIKSHFIDYADQDRAKPFDLVKIGALFNVIQREDEETEHFRRRLRNTIRLYLEGLGTSDAMARMAALTFDLDVPRETYPDGKEIIIRPETGFSPADRFTTMANLYRPETAALFPDENNGGGETANFDEVNFEKSVWMQIIDNPPFPQRLMKGVRPGQNWETMNESVIESELELRINAHYRSQKFPTLTNRSTGQIIRFRGTVPQGQELGITTLEGDVLSARMNGTDVSDFLEVVKGALFDCDSFDTAYFAGERVLPVVPKKRSKWHFAVASAVFGADEVAGEGVYVASGASFVADGIALGEVPDKDKFAVDEFDTDHALFILDPRDQFDQAYFEMLEVAEFDSEEKRFGDTTEAPVVVFGGAPLADVRFDWEAREPASFLLSIPGDELLDVADIAITGTRFVEDGATGVPRENQFDSGRFAVDPRDQLIMNIEEIKAAGIRASVVFQ